MQTLTPKYKRVLLKLSGEALAAGADGILNFDFIDSIAEVLKDSFDSPQIMGKCVFS